MQWWKNKATKKGRRKEKNSFPADYHNYDNYDNYDDILVVVDEDDDVSVVVLVLLETSSYGTPLNTLRHLL